MDDTHFVSNYALQSHNMIELSVSRNSFERIINPDEDSNFTSEENENDMTEYR